MTRRATLRTRPTAEPRTSGSAVADAASPSPPDPVVSTARGGSLNLVAAACSQLSWMLVLLLVARVLGTGGVGRYAQAYAFLPLLGLLSLSGFRSGLTRFVAMHVADADTGALRGTVRLGLTVSVASAFLLAGGLLVGAPVVADAFGDPGLVPSLRVVAAALPAATFVDAALSACQGFGTMRDYALVGNVLDPLLRLALTAVALAAGKGVHGALLAVAVSAWVTAVVSGLRLRRRMRRLKGRPRYETRELFAYSSLSWIATLAGTGLVWADTLLLGALRPDSDVGVYNVATRVVALAAFVMTPITASFAPRVASLHTQARFTDLERTYRATTSWTLRLTIPAFVVLAVFPDVVLSAFGERFEVAATVTVLLVIGRLADAATGPSGLLLNMTGHNRLSAINNLAVLVLNVVLNLVLIPRLGVVGAALAWTLALVLMNLARLLEVRSILRLSPFDRACGKGVVAGGAALAAALVIRALVPSEAQLVLGVLVSLAVYVGALLKLRLTTQDLLVLRSIVPAAVLRRLSTTGGTGP